MAASSRKEIVDIAALVEDWAWDYFRKKATKKQLKLISQELIAQEIDWKRVLFSHAAPVYEPEPPKIGSGKPMHNTLFYTTYTNKTDSKQRYTFKAERTSRSSCTVAIEQGFMQGVEANVKIGTPWEIFEANVGFKREISVTNIDEQTTEEEMTWGVDSEIEVEPRHRAEAKLIIYEEEYKGTFVVKTTISGRVRVIFYNRKDNNSFMRAIEGQMDVIVDEMMKKRRLPQDVIYIDGATKSVVCTTRGKCQFKYGLKQDVEVDQISLNNVR